VGRSISAPVPTSTTNASVARVEGVWCGELTQAGLVQSTRSSQAGWISDSSCDAEHVEKVGKAAEVANETEGSMINGMDRIKSQVRKPRNATLLRLGGAFRGHLDSITVSRRQLIADKIQFSKLEEECMSSTAQRKAEGINLCRQRTRNLTGHGSVKRKPVEKVHHQLSAKNIGERHHDERPLLMSSSMSSHGRLDEKKEHPNLTHDYTFGDLERSVMNAVDELDFRQTLQQTPDSMASPNHRQSLLAGLYQKDTNNGNARLPTAINKAGIHTSSPEPCAFSVSQAVLVPTPTNKGRRRANPLGCHPNVMGMAELLVDTSEVSTPPMDTSTPPIEITKEEAEELEDAPIYSPSSGNLSQYARSTPSPARLKEIKRNVTPVDEASKSETKDTTAAGGKAAGAGSPEMQQKPQASNVDERWPAQEADGGMETLELSPYRVGNSRRVIGWARLPSSPGYRSAPPSRTTYGYPSNENLRSTD